MIALVEGLGVSNENGSVEAWRFGVAVIKCVGHTGVGYVCGVYDGKTDLLAFRD